jgi:hypothetical protein
VNLYEFTYGLRGYPAVRQCAAIRAAVCGSARGGAQQCVDLCVAMFGSKHGGVRTMRAVRPAVCCSAIGSVRQCVAVCGLASTRRSRCVAVRSTCNIHKVVHNIHSLTEAVGMCLIFLTYL